jgi:hypothetical protein
VLVPHASLVPDVTPAATSTRCGNFGSGKCDRFVIAMWTTAKS